MALTNPYENTMSVLLTGFRILIEICMTPWIKDNVNKNLGHID
jgi:hypothetical protein